MNGFARTDRSVMGLWWWTVDRWSLAALILLMGVGALLVLAASPAVAIHLKLDSFYLVRHHFALLVPAAIMMVAISLMTPLGIRRLAVIGLILALALTAITLVGGTEIKGARRWIDLLGLSIQPSEFVKPCFAVVAAWMFAEQHGKRRLPGNAISILLYLMIVALLMAQPDFGMTFVISVTWFAQFVLAGLPLLWVGGLGVVGVGGVIGAYYMFPHVTTRIDGFLNPAGGDTYQVDRSLEAFVNGGLYGVGPGEGTVKQVLPDAHSDFVFAVAGEEFGFIACLLIVLLFAFIVLRGYTRLLRETNMFVLLAASGIITDFGLQAFINMASTLHLMPTKGMTLPFISYGGSSLLALALAMGMFLALTRRRSGDGALT
ncbi:MAG TPA: putative lipid II flippase FtsW [Dongiaceae bacterium]|jgi:cell division protein FtsW|nr:putative lipid II flippase FtsW [Dongiaceae bacterium]